MAPTRKSAVAGPAPSSCPSQTAATCNQNFPIDLIPHTHSTGPIQQLDLRFTRKSWGERSSREFRPLQHSHASTVQTTKRRTGVDNSGERDTDHGRAPGEVQRPAHLLSESRVGACRMCQAPRSPLGEDCRIAEILRTAGAAGVWSSEATASPRRRSALSREHSRQRRAPDRRPAHHGIDIHAPFRSGSHGHRARHAARGGVQGAGRQQDVTSGPLAAVHGKEASTSRPQHESMVVRADRDWRAASATCNQKLGSGASATPIGSWHAPVALQYRTSPPSSSRRASGRWACARTPRERRRSELSDRKFDPFWAKAEELGVMLFMHPAGGRHDFNHRCRVKAGWGTPSATRSRPPCFSRT